METTLDQLREGDCARILSLQMRGAMRRRLLDFGMIEGTSVRCVRQSPAGDPVLYLVRGTMLALRRQDGRQIAVEVVSCR
ncbi:MAG: ferrous iron transport protein A [Oscillospiraceae bacterium]|nr:ferrous iron transport protein A [Oscillospiraceae bacterium]